MRYRSLIKMVIQFTIWMLFLSGCGQNEESETVLCHLVFEEQEGIQIENPAVTVERGEDASFVVHLLKGYDLEAVDYEGAELVRDEFQDTVTVTLSDVRYSTSIRGNVSYTDRRITYDGNGGNCIGDESAVTVVQPIKQAGAKINTAQGSNLFERDGYTIIGWNTEPDGSGDFVGLGSRASMREKALTLYAVWAKWSEEELFTWEQAGEYIVITGNQGELDSLPSDALVVPGKIQGREVIAVEGLDVRGDSVHTLILPPTLQRLGELNLPSLECVYIYDSINEIGEYCFAKSPELKTLHIEAASAPVYSNNYFATFQDKYDRLCSLEGERKIVLFSGSSARFGYDSAKIDEAFPEYQVVNMGVFAYTNALPQLRLIEAHMKEGDILLHSPEFDAAKRQFCTTTDLDDSFFCMMEADYDVVAQLDLREFTNVFTALRTYLKDRKGMEEKSYALSPADYDEDGNPSEQSYNEYGDYILYRENASTDEPVYNLPVEYTRTAFPEDLFIDPVNAVYRELQERGITVYFTYAPRNKQALSSDSTEEERALLHQYFQEKLCVPVISSMEESLYPGRYLYGTDNHLSTEGVQIRTDRIIEDLQKQLEE